MTISFMIFLCVVFIISFIMNIISGRVSVMSFLQLAIPKQTKLDIRNHNGHKDLPVTNAGKS